jgi:protein-tyrosine phosphatase
VIDLHCHLLPGLDDGPADEAEALALAEALVDCGITTVACTPHVPYRSTGGPSSARIQEAVAELRAILAAHGLELELVAGAEVNLTRAIDLADEELKALRLGDGPWLLLEAPHHDAIGVEQAIQRVALRGHRILLAHPERCPAFQEDQELLSRLVHSGMLAQVTASSLTGAFGSRVERFARRLVDGGLVQVVASDAHHATGRPPGVLAELRTAGYANLAPLLTDRVPRAILAGEPIPAPPEPAPAKRRWWRRG